MDIRNLKGSIVALVTPFHPDGSVNFEKLRELTEWHIENGTDAILALGTTGESSTMTHEEDDAVLRCVIETAAGRVPVIAGTGSNSTQTMLEKSLRAEALGADGLLLITPYYNKGNPEGICRHFLTVADAVKIPCILYNVPGRTGCAISVENVERLAKHPNICGIKEASGDMSYAMRIAHCIGPDFALWCGNDDITIPLLSIGGSGVISVWANIQPRECHEMVMDYLEGRRERAAAAAVKYLELMNVFFLKNIRAMWRNTPWRTGKSAARRERTYSAQKALRIWKRMMPLRWFRRGLNTGTGAPGIMAANTCMPLPCLPGNGWLLPLIWKMSR